MSDSPSGKELFIVDNSISEASAKPPGNDYGGPGDQPASTSDLPPARDPPPATLC